VAKKPKHRHRLDTDALELLCSFQGIIGVGGRPVPRLVPHRDFTSGPHAADEQMDFDRAVCEAGLKEFIRPTLPGDRTGPDSGWRPAFDNMPEEMKERCHKEINDTFVPGGWVLVKEIRPGFRTRSVIILEMNQPQLHGTEEVRIVR
jgi:hypothetical protein